MDFGMKEQGTVLLCMEQEEPEAVKIAAENLETDLGRSLSSCAWHGKSEKKMG